MLALTHDEDIVGQDYPARELDYTGPPRGSRRWCGTWNNYPANAIDTLQRLTYPKVEWGIFARETAPTTNTPHLQIYIAFKNNVKYQTLRGLFPGAWWKIARGNHHDNYLYVTKTRPAKTYNDGTERAADVPNDVTDVFEIGTRPNFAAMLEGMLDALRDFYRRASDIHYLDDDQISDDGRLERACLSCQICTNCMHDMTANYACAMALLDLNKY